MLQDDYNHWGTCHSPEQKNLNARRRRSLVLEEDDNVSPYANDISSLCRSRCKELKQRQPIQGFNKQKKRKKKEIGLRKRQDKIKAEFKLLNVKREAEDAECHILESTKRSTSPTSAENVRPKVKKTPEQMSVNFSVSHHKASI